VEWSENKQKEQEREMEINSDRERYIYGQKEDNMEWSFGMQSLDLKQIISE
jgi:hypothetical protein